MKIINAGYEFITPINGDTILSRIEEIARVCYKSEYKITDKSYLKFIKVLIDNGHEAMIEHCSFSVKFICDRGISHEIVRHRLFSFAQESTRYCNYGGKDITFILPCWFDEGDKEMLLKNSQITKKWWTDHYELLLSKSVDLWVEAMLNAEESYHELIDEHEWSPQQARATLPNSLKTEIVVTGNLREWRHFFKLRTAETAHPQMREITCPLLKELKIKIPVIFDDIIN